MTTLITGGPGMFSYTPTNGQYPVPLDTSIVLTYSQAISAPTVNAQAMVGYRNYKKIPGQTYHFNDRTVTFTPTIPLQPGELIHITVLTTAQDLNGLNVVNPTVWHFTTAVTRGTGQFGPHPVSPTFGAGDSTEDGVFADIDLDGDLDVIVTKRNAAQAVHLNDGHGNFSNDPAYTFGGTNAQEVVLGDVDGDGDLDVFLVGTGRSSTLHLNNSGVLSDTAAVTFTSDDNTAAVGDVDGDGDLDVIFSKNGGSSSVYRNDGAGGFTAHLTFGNGGRGLALGDVNGDGDLDVFVARIHHPTELYLNAGDGTFTLSADRTFTGDSRTPVLGDLDQDGDLDVVLSRWVWGIGNAIELYFNNGQGLFGDPVFVSAATIHDIALGDVDGDGDLDMAATQDTDRVIYLNDGNGTFTYLPQGEIVTSRAEVQLGDIDGDRDLDMMLVSSTGVHYIYQNRSHTDLALSQTVNTNTAVGDQTITFTLHFTNTGPEAPSSFAIVDQFPDILSNIQVISSGVTLQQSNVGRSYTWFAPTLPVNASGIITISATLDHALTTQVITNTARIQAAAIDPTANNEASVSVQVAAPVMTVLGQGQIIAKGDTTPTLLDGTEFGVHPVGFPVTHTFTISNSGLVALTLSDVPPVTISGPGADSFSIATSPSSSTGPNSTTTFDIVFNARSKYPVSATITLSNTNDSQANPYRFDVSGQGASTELQLTKAVTPRQQTTDAPITYTIAFTNNGTLAAQGVVITDIVPWGVLSPTVQSNKVITPVGSTNYVWQVEDLAVNETGLITLTGHISPGLSPMVIANTATITSSSLELNPTNQQDTASVAVKCIGVRLHVNQAATGANTGLSWADAMPSLKTALDHLHAIRCPDAEIWVATGRYTPGITTTDTFNLLPGMKLYGGFAGTETALNQRDWVNNPTILSGDIAGDDLNTDGNHTAEIYTDIVGENSNLLLSLGDIPSWFVDPKTIGRDTIIDGFIVTAAKAGGLSINSRYLDDGSAVSPTLQNLIFSGNMGGAALYMYIWNARHSAPFINQVIFRGNTTSSLSDGVVHLLQVGGTAELAPQLTNVAFENNGNTSLAFKPLNNTGGKTLVLDNVSFTKNTNTEFVIYIPNPIGSKANLHLNNVTIADNVGAAMILQGNMDIHLSNSIVWESESVWGSPGLTYDSAISHQNGSATMYISNTIVMSYPTSVDFQDGGGTVAGPNVLTSNPGFVDSANGNFQLDARSPAVDAGDNRFVSLSHDLAGNPRRYDDLGVTDSGSGSKPIVDMGAFERQLNSPYADMQIHKTVTPTTAVPGQVLTYTIHFTHAGINTTPGVVITDLLPSNITVQQVISSGSVPITLTQLTPSQAVFDVGTMSPGQSGTITLTAQLDQPLVAQIITNTAHIAAFEGDPHLFNNQSRVGVTVANVAPTLTTSPAHTITETQPFTFSVSTADQNGDTLAIGLNNAPAGAMIDQTGHFSWTPSEIQGPGTYTFTIVISDTGSPALTDSQPVIITVDELNTAPTLAPIAPLTINETQTVTFTTSVTDADIPVQGIVYSLHDAPTGTTIDSNGHFNWTPSETQGGQRYTFTVVISDTGSPVLTDSQPVVVEVIDTNIAPVFAPVSSQTITETETLTFSVSATDGDLPAQSLSYSLSGPSFGATLDQTGHFTWTPSEAQGGSNYTFTVVVSDTGSPILTSTQQIVVSVVDTNVTPVLNFITDQTISETNTLTFSVSATDGDLPAQAVTYGLGNAPSGATMDATGHFTWTPSDARGGSSYSLTIIAQDNGSPVLTDSQQLTINVVDTFVAPVLSPVSPQTVDETTPLSFTVSATDSDVPTQTLSYGLNDAPSGANIDNDGRFTWTPSEAQGGSSYTFTVVVSDTSTPILTDSQPVVITVNDTNVTPQLAAIGSFTITETATLTFTTHVTDTDLPTQTLHYSLLGAPNGAIIDQSGHFTWATTEVDGPGVYYFSVVITDTGSPIAMVSQPVTVTVNEVNTAPVLAPIGNFVISETLTLDFTATATDTDLPAPSLHYSLSGAPSGAFISSNGFFIWRPSEMQGGSSYTFTVVVSDNGTPVLTDSEQIVVTVIDTNVAPILSSLSDRSVVEGDTLAFNAPATDYDMPSQGLTYRLQEAPNGATVDNNGDVSWTPVEADGPGTYTFTVVISDTGTPALADSQSMRVTVFEQNTPPVLAPINPQTITETETLTFTAVVSDSDLPAQGILYDVIGAPDGVQIVTTTGEIRWTPTEIQGPATYTFTVVVSDTHAIVMTDTQQIVVTVTELNTAPTLAPIANQSIGETMTLTFSTSVSDTDLPAQSMTYGLNGAPNGASIDSNGTFSWTPTETQGGNSYTLTVVVTDSFGLSDSQTVVVTVDEVNAPPVLATIAPQTAIETEPFSLSVIATDNDLPTQGFIYALNAAPIGMMIDSNGLISWTPTESDGPNTFTFTVVVTDTGSPALATHQQIVVTVNELNTAPVLASIGSRTLVELQPFTLTLSAADVDVPANSLIYSVINAPAGAMLNGHTFSWTPTAEQGPGIYPLTFIVSDNGSPVLTASETITLTVNNGPGVIITEADDVTTVGETGLTDTYAIALNSPPTATVTISITPTSPLLVASNVVSFTAANWQTPQTITVSINDDGLYQGPRSGLISHVVSSNDLAYSGIAVQDIVVAIADDTEDQPMISIENLTVDESVGTAMISVTLTGQSTFTSSIDYTIDAGSAMLGSDYTADNGTLTWTAFASGTHLISVTIVDDQLDEANETVLLSLSNPISSTLVHSNGVLTITDNDLPSQLSLSKNAALTNNPVQPGDTITYTIVITNNGGTAENVIVEDILPFGLSGNDLFWSGTITAGETISFTLNATIEPGSLMYDAVITNTVTFTYGATSGQDTATFTIIPDTTPPDVTPVTLVGPTAGISLTTSQPTFDWSDASDDESGVMNYTIIITGEQQTYIFTTTDSVFTPTTDLPPGNYTWTVQANDAAGNSSLLVDPPASFSIVSLDGEPGRLYLPLIMHNSSALSGPDLVVTQLVATSNLVTVTIRNVGDVTVTNPFWVDVYFNPSEPPSINRPWDSIAQAGAVWGVDQQLPPGQSLTLTVGDEAYHLNYSSSSFPIEVATFGYVDSVNLDTTYGGVLESNEANNLFGPIISVLGKAESEPIVEQAPLLTILPNR
ncbi:MAG: putative Ig domain-containing protein [Chloroflexota bacterium]